MAGRELAGRRVDARQLAGVTNLFGYEAAVLLDERGRVLHAEPAKASLIGSDLTVKYAHLRAAAAGRTAVSGVVPSAAKGIPIVAFATPFATAHGRRVFSGAFDVAKTPIGAYLRNTTSLKGARVYLVDAKGLIVASNRPKTRGISTLEKADAPLARALRRSSADQTLDGRQYASRAVRQTPWRLIISAPRTALFRPVSGARRLVPWILWTAAVAAALGCVVLVSRLMTSRAQLRSTVGQLDQLARTDALTSLANRRQIQEALEVAILSAELTGRPLSVLMVDVDRFKAVNDTYGHKVGDEVLQDVAAAVRQALRSCDAVGRWGGEEFLVLLPSTDAAEAETVAQRVRQAVADSVFVVDGRLLAVTVSIGASTCTDGPGAALVARADDAMYAAKAAGRDNVHVALANTQPERSAL